MRPAVVTAVLLLVFVLDSVTAEPDFGAPYFCQKYSAPPCGDGWSRIAADRCAKFIGTRKNFNDAQAHCNSLNSNLVSLHSEDEANFLTCLTWFAVHDYKLFWIGAKRSGGVFGFIDGSKFNYKPWQFRQPNNSGGQEDCIESDYNSWDYWNDVTCTKERFFACAKKM
ncbi:C-type isolectin Sp-CL4-like isoform X2 [Sander vitreus]